MAEGGAPAPDTELLPLTVRGLGYTVRGSALLADVDLCLETPGVTVIMGPNGAGKSLLLRLLHGLIAPSAGDVRWAGQPLTPAVRARQALVFQRPVLLRRTALANVEFVLRARRADVAAAAHCLAQVGLADKAERPARRLSGGEQQRLALARALALDPSVLLLDEPTASLDPASVAAIEAIVAGVAARGVKVIAVTHDTAQARRLADDVVFLHGGRVVEHAGAGAFFTAPASAAARRYLDGELVL